MLFAEHQGFWLNSLLTITWKKCAAVLADSAEDLQDAQRTVLSRIARVYRNSNQPLYFAWAKEHAPAGVHTHFWLHLAPARFMDERKRLLDTLAALLQPQGCGIDLRGDELNGRPGYRKRHEMCRQILYATKNLTPQARARAGNGSLVQVREYLALDAAARQAGLRRSSTPIPSSWPSWGKVTGASETLGPKARATRGWKELTTIDDLRDAIWRGFSPLNDPSSPPAPPCRRRTG
jgi:hypothetical protein